MKVEVKKIDKLKRVVDITVEGEAFVAEKKGLYLEIGKNLKVPGFRPGSAPAEILEKHHGAALKEEFLRRIIPPYYERALQDEKLVPASAPRIYDVKLTEESLSFCAELEVKPELQIQDKDYKTITIKDKKIEVKEEEIKKVITNLKDGVKKVITGDLDDQALARWASYPDASSLREAIRTEIFMEKMKERRRDIHDQIMRHLLKEIKTFVPKSEVEQHHKELIEREIYTLQLRNIPQADIDKYKKDLEEKLKPIAEDEVKLFYIVEEIARRENIKAPSNLFDVVFGFILSVANFQ